MKKRMVWMVVLLCIGMLAGCGRTPEPATPNAMIPMVMVDGVIYMTTGYESMPTDRPEGFDGEITSTVSGSEAPTENDQSNFGTGYGYQFGETEGTVDLFINEKWWIYATEEARDRIFYPEHYMVIDSPSAFSVTCGEVTIEPRTGSIQWEYTKEDGTDGALLGDGLHPLEAKQDSPCLPLTPKGSLDAWLYWEIMPDRVSVRYWGEECWTDVDAKEVENFRLMESNEAGDCFLLHLKDGNYIYEVTATWHNAPNFSGTVYYSFHTEK